MVAFDGDGFLPAGIHGATWTEFTDRFAYNNRRRLILQRVAPILQHLAAFGCPSILVGGSFVTAKDEPKDIDFVWMALNGMDFSAMHPALFSTAGINWLRFKVGADIFPSNWIEADSGERFAIFFQHTKDGRPKGVVAVDLSTMP